MSKWSGKTRGTPLGYKIFIITLKIFGLEAAYFILIFVALYFSLFSYSSSKHSYRFQRKLGRSIARSLLGVYENYYKMGQCILDKMLVKIVPDHKFKISHASRPHLEKIMKGGGMILTAHVGNWEMSGQLLNKTYSSTPVNVLMFDGEYEKIKELISKSSKKENSFNIIPVKKDFSHLFKLLNVLQNKEVLCLQGDRYLNEEKGHLSHSFLGEEAYFPKGPFSLACRFKVPVTFSFAMKVSSKEYFFWASEPKVYSDPKDMLKDYVLSLESMIKKYPDQWFNYFDFWAK